jgi:hypothetical protein
VQVSYDDGSTWTTVWSKSNVDASENAWTLTNINLAPGGSSMRIRFTFNTGDWLQQQLQGLVHRRRLVDPKLVLKESLCIRARPSSRN